jgi:hypothetical protein
LERVPIAAASLLANESDICGSQQDISKCEEADKVYDVIECLENVTNFY